MKFYYRLIHMIWMVMIYDVIPLYINEKNEKNIYIKLTGYKWMNVWCHVMKFMALLIWVSGCNTSRWTSKMIYHMMTNPLWSSIARSRCHAPRSFHMWKSYGVITMSKKLLGKERTTWEPITHSCSITKVCTNSMTEFL